MRALCLTGRFKTGMNAVRLIVPVEWRTAKA
jgi:hypothetical protein